MSNRMIINDEKDKTPKTSIKMTRAMGEDVGWIALDIMTGIEEHNIDLTFSRWEWFVSHFWDDEIWKKTLNKIILNAKNMDIDINKNQYFLDFMFENIATELNNAMKKGVHPIFRQAFMELVTKEKAKPLPKRKYEDLWLSPKERKQKKVG